MSRVLCIAIHDVAPATWPRCEVLFDLLRTLGAPPTTLLVVPDYHRRGSIENDVVGHAGYHARAVVPIEGGEQIFEKAAPASIERGHVGFLLAR